MDNMCIDIHVHSNYSTCAKQTIPQLMNKALSSGIKILSLTDHNCVAGIDEALAYSRDKNITIIPGVELSVSSNENTMTLPLFSEIYVLGYGLDYSLFDARIESISKMGRKRIQAIISYLKENGYPITVEEFSAFSKEELKTKLVEKAVFKDKKEAKAFLNSSEIVSKFPPARLSVAEGINLIHDLGGIAVIAHPCEIDGKTTLERAQYLELVNYLIQCGIDGIEVFHVRNFNAGGIDDLLKLCKENNLYSSIGSDRHFCDDRYGNSYFSFQDKMDEYTIGQLTIKSYLRKRGYII